MNAAARKGLVIILDGLGDRQCAQLDNQTPLQAANTPTLDAVARDNQTGLMDPYQPGVSVDTHTGVGILFGAPPEQAIQLRRGPIEAAGIDLPMQPGEVFLRANFATVEIVSGGDGNSDSHSDSDIDGDDNGNVDANRYHIIDRRAGRIDDEVAELCAQLTELPIAPTITADVFPATQHRAVLRLRGANLSAQITDTDPAHEDADINRCVPRDEVSDKRDNDSHNDAEYNAAVATANAINRFTQLAHQRLANHPLNLSRVAAGKLPGNAIIARSAGMHHALDALRLRKLKVAAVAGEKTVLGLAKLFNFTRITDARFTSLPNTDLRAKLQAARQALREHQLVFLHIKGTDTAAHDKQPRVKADFIEKFDRELGAMLAQSPDTADLIIGVCADHATDSNCGEHNADAVPVLLRNPHAAADGVAHYHEAACEQGGLGRITAAQFLMRVLAAMDVQG